jgi:hypothetical protein
MNESIYTADRNTHLKIVVVGLLIATLVAGFGIAMQASHSADDLFAARGPSVHQPVNGITATAGAKTRIR